MNSASPQPQPQPQSQSQRQTEGRFALGIDVGGTKVAGGIVDLASGRIHARRQVPTDYERGGAAIIRLRWRGS